jgi:predicted small secreted protein
MLKKIVLVLAALAALSLTACNTVAGAGKDVSATGNAVTDAAKETKSKM